MLFRRLAEEYGFAWDKVAGMTLAQTTIYLKDQTSDTSVFRRSKKFGSLAAAMKFAKERKHGV